MAFELRIFRKRDTFVRVTDTQTEPEGNNDEVFALLSMRLLLPEIRFMFIIVDIRCN